LPEKWGIGRWRFSCFKNFVSRLYLSPRESRRKSDSEVKPVSEKIGALTFHLYLQNGCPEGREADFWRRARKMVADKTPTAGMEAAIS